MSVRIAEILALAKLAASTNNGGNTGGGGGTGGGVTPTFSIGTVETLDAGSNATASISGTKENPVLNLGIPQGLPGEVVSGGGGSEWRLIRTVTIPEDITTDTSGVAFAEQSGGGTTFAFDTDENGKPFELTELVVYAYAATPHTIGNFCINLSESVPKYFGGAKVETKLSIGVDGKLTSSVSWSTLLQFDDAKKTVHSVSYGASFGGGSNNWLSSLAKVVSSPLAPGYQFADIDKIRRCNCYMSNLASYGFSAGSTFSFYGR